MFLLASSPFLAFLLWAAWWLTAEVIRERRRDRIAARFAARYADNRDDQVEERQAPAA